MELNINKTAQEVYDQYQMVESIGYNIMVYGQAGTWKTGSITTCPKPVHVYSFDRHGWSPIKKYIDGRNINVDTRFEGAFGSRIKAGQQETIFNMWQKDFKEKANGGYFDAVGTLVFDSATTWALSIMDQVRKTGGKVMTDGNYVITKKMTPDQKDWQIQMECIKLALDDFLSLPCNCYLICHEITEVYGDNERILTMPLLTGKLREQIPPMFDEVYRAEAVSGSSGNRVRLLTQNDGNIVAKSRLAQVPEGKKSPLLDKYEPFNIKKLMLKVGLEEEARDKPPLF